ncbi:MAG: hypothetical protein IIA83_00610 [Thaumarchaeota archaeon]|nr:hypothetical protein [Nitrososphaerota archaeon]
MNKVDIGLVVGLGAIFIVGLFLVLIPIITLLDVETVSKVSGIYDEPIFLTFHWITDDEIQVGKLITFDVQVHNLPYTKNMTLNSIEISFIENQINYWYDQEDSRQNKYPQSDIVTLYPDWKNKIFKSDKINFRFIIPEDISIQYCDYNLETPCSDILKIIHPAPYDLANRIDSNRIVITLSLIIASLSTIVVWSRLRDTLKK